VGRVRVLRREPGDRPKQPSGPQAQRRAPGGSLLRCAERRRTTSPGAACPSQPPERPGGHRGRVVRRDGQRRWPWPNRQPGLCPWHCGWHRERWGVRSDGLLRPADGPRLLACDPCLPASGRSWRPDRREQPRGVSPPQHAESSPCLRRTGETSALTSVVPTSVAKPSVVQHQTWRSVGRRESPEARRARQSPATASLRCSCAARTTEDHEVGEPQHTRVGALDHAQLGRTGGEGLGR